MGYGSKGENWIMENMNSLELAEQFRRIRHLTSCIMSYSGLSHSEFCLISIIKANEEQGGVIVSDIVSEMKVTPPAVSRSLKSLESRGFLKRETNELNHRNTTVRLTEKGTEVFDSAYRTFSEVMNLMQKKIGKEKTGIFCDTIKETTKIMSEYVAELDKKPKD